MADYENFVRALLPRLLRYATMLTGEREQAADLVQDALVKVYRRWSRISGTSSATNARSVRGSCLIHGNGGTGGLPCV